MCAGWVTLQDLALTLKLFVARGGIKEQGKLTVMLRRLPYLRAKCAACATR